MGANYIRYFWSTHKVTNCQIEIMRPLITTMMLGTGYSLGRINVNDEDPFALQSKLETPAALEPFSQDQPSICEDTSQVCKNGKCCPMRNSDAVSKYGCCPYPNGVCCPHIGRCCKDGYQCISPETVDLLNNIFTIGGLVQSGESISSRFHCIVDFEVFKLSDLWTGPPLVQNTTL